MTKLFATGLAAGLASALLFAAIVGGSSLGIILFYLTSLPLLIAGLGWGWMSAAIGALAGGLSTGIAAGPYAGLLFLVSVGVPAAILSYLALLSRVGANGETEWYPVGRLVFATAVMGIVLIAATMILIGGDLSAYRDVLVTMLGDMMTAGGSEESNPEQIALVADRMVALLPAASGMMWLAMTLLNLYIAGRIVRASNRLVRPWPDIARLELPLMTSVALAIAVGLWLVGGVIGKIASAATAILMLCLALVGLGIIHVVSRSISARGFLLAGLYLSILMIFWPLVLLAMLGAIEPRLRLRDRQRPPQTPTT